MEAAIRENRLVMHPMREIRKVQARKQQGRTVPLSVTIAKILNEMKTN